jgi:hypothetical protein
MTSPFGPLAAGIVKPFPTRGAAARERPSDRLAPVLSWDDFLTWVFDWRQNQHIAMIGPTDSGKSTLTYQILPFRRFVTFFATKPRDHVLDQFAAAGGFVRIDDWPPYHPKNGRTSKGMLRHRRPVSAVDMPRRLLWPDATTIFSPPHQREVFHRAFSDIYTDGGWCVVWDEFWHMTNILKLEQEARIMLQQARSNDISFVVGAQRPSRVPLEIYDQSTHVFFWRDNDEINLKRMSGIGWLASGPIRAFVANLDPHQVLYVKTRSGAMFRTTAPPA